VLLIARPFALLLALVLVGGCEGTEAAGDATTAEAGAGSASSEPDARADASPPDANIPGAERDPDYVFDDTVVRTYEVTVVAEDWDSINNDPNAEQYVPATLLFEGRTYRDVAIRFKGGWGSLYTCVLLRACAKLSMKLKFSEYDREGRFHNLERLNLHAMTGLPMLGVPADLTKVHEALAYGLLRDFGVEAPRSSYAWLVVNGEVLGLFALVEQIDGRFTRSHFDDGGEGNLYKEV